MTQEETAPRFEIHIEEPSALGRRYGIDYPMHVVWDSERGRAVPFGRYRSAERAKERLDREWVKLAAASSSEEKR